MMHFKSFLHAFRARSLQERRDLRAIICVLVVSPLALIVCTLHIFRAQHDPSLISPQYVGRLELISTRQNDVVFMRRNHVSSDRLSNKLPAKAIHRDHRPKHHSRSQRPQPSKEDRLTVINNFLDEDSASMNAEKGESFIVSKPAFEGELEVKLHDQCEGKYVYIYKLPPYFNEDLIDKCGRTTGDWVDLCGNLNNNGFGPSISATTVLVNASDPDSIIEFEPPHAWFRTEQFSLETIFHERLRKGYPCLTQDPELANAFFIPYYAALDTAFTLFEPHLPQRDRLAQRLIGWLSGSNIWMKFQGSRPHFMVLGRISWDLSRDEKALEGWGSSLLSQSELSNVTMLLIERRTWVSNEIAIPYPTSFHPSSLSDVALWQEKLKGQMSKRTKLSTLIGTTSRGTEWSKKLRAELANECGKVDNRTCQEHKCGNGYADTFDCARHPEHVNALFLTSVFCLEPSGDSPTRKGIFDSLLAGCIPVLFLESSAYNQYLWHLPLNGSLYSVLFDGEDVIHGKIDIFAVLAEIAQDTARLRRMQEEVINLLPRIVYSSPPSDHSSDAIIHDAFDIALDNILKGSPIHTM